MIYFLIVNYYSTDLILKLINSIQKTNYFDYKVIIINNSPDDNSIDNIKTESLLIFDAGANLGFGCACNLGLKWIYIQDPQAYVWLINPDTYLIENTLDKIKPFFELHPEVSIVGTIIYTPVGEVWFAGGRFISKTGAILNQDLLTNIDTAYATCDWVSGCSLIINLRKFSACPLFDPAYFLYYEDFDFCRYNANQGHLIVVTKQFSVIHQISSITNRNMFIKMKHSTYSYLLTLEKYTDSTIQILRLAKLLCYAFVLIAIKPQVAFGKISGVLLYWRRSLRF
ncbi:glycosyl transferase [Nostoc sp. 'Peltigera membranacea cyanobiont' 210A]|uniref:glycosyltransferase n=1 Tax=Nostoc sp. 'Peltigera membranacea cyanobiont' 210A TaxID=2014529 RepID=UPI000B95AA7D|nr:glycosyltransferase [Nostoc sp. 'Peltigera membranacea cyanobiont' 210A]OYD91105.1 glycosyl transferase [Nostoc sp. 'Peltigera membranacea cyanobiont' 210A]